MYTKIRHINEKTQYLDNLIYQQKSILKVPSISKNQAHTDINSKTQSHTNLTSYKKPISYLGFLICTLRRSLNIL